MQRTSSGPILDGWVEQTKRSESNVERRTFLSLAALSLATPGSIVLAGEGSIVDYSPEAYESAMAAGEPVLLDFTLSS